MARLRGRRTDSEQVISRRLRDALGDMSHWSEFDFVIINDDLDTAIDELEAILEGGREANRTSNSLLRQRVAAILA